MALASNKCDDMRHRRIARRVDGVWKAGLFSFFGWEVLRVEDSCLSPNRCQAAANSVRRGRRISRSKGTSSPKKCDAIHARRSAGNASVRRQKKEKIADLRGDNAARGAICRAQIWGCRIRDCRETESEAQDELRRSPDVQQSRRDTRTLPTMACRNQCRNSRVPWKNMRFRTARIAFRPPRGRHTPNSRGTPGTICRPPASISCFAIQVPVLKRWALRTSCYTARFPR